ncbi:hypothetical protein DZK27_05595 [Rhodobacteraceae bacterium 63075]|nr:hypothetical protein DZK27_05595 [Rhodobacteraceae bacterium 63075]
MNIASSQTGVFNAKLPPRAAVIASSFRGLNGELRNMIVGLFLSFFAAVSVYADERLQDWVPGVLTLPEDAEILTDRAIGSTIRMFSLETEADADTLLTDWEESLANDGYTVTEGIDDRLGQSVEFSGDGIANAKIIVAPSSEGERTVIEFDATLN